jgi:hypothetical protein
MRKSVSHSTADIALSMDTEGIGRLVLGPMGANPLIYDFSSS